MAPRFLRIMWSQTRQWHGGGRGRSRARRARAAATAVAFLLTVNNGCRTNIPILAPSSNSTQPSGHAGTIFRDVAQETGLDFHHFAGATGGWYFPETAGSGVAVLDYDNDGDLDIYFVQASALGPGKSVHDSVVPMPQGWKPGCRLYRNMLKETGKLRFEDVTDSAGVGFKGCAMGATVGDVDNDGFPDLYVTAYGRNVLYSNKRNGTFADITAQAGVDDPRWSAGAAFFDYDADGWLDLVVANYVDHTVKGDKPCFVVSGKRDYCGPSAYHGLPARLFHNEHNGRFRDVTLESGIGSESSSGLGVSCFDANRDGRIDIFIANDGRKNHLWMNMGGGKFSEEGMISGVALDVSGAPRANMGLAVGNYDNGESDHVLVSHLTGEGVSVYANNGSGVFNEAANELGFRAATIPFTGFGTEWLDYDNDGWLDLFIANGAVTTIESQMGKPYPFEQTNQLFHNNGGVPVTFREVTREAGPALERLGVGRGVAIGDLNNDGKIDVVVSNNNGPALLLLNESPQRGHWLLARLQGSRCNRDGLGAYVSVIRRGQKPLRRRCHTDGSYCSASDSRVHFGLGDMAEIEAVAVTWPDGSKERFTGVRADSIALLRQGGGLKEP
jgi:enediyne biosynthesis protein E4